MGRSDWLDPALGRVTFKEWPIDWQPHASVRHHWFAALVFAAPDGDPARLSLWRRRFWQPAIDAAGVTPLRLHGLRHPAVAFGIAASLTPLGIAKRASHTSVVTVQDRYGHLLPGSERPPMKYLTRWPAALAAPRRRM